MTASLLRRDAAHIMKIAFAGTRASRLVGVVEAAFVGEESKIKETSPLEGPLEEETEIDADIPESGANDPTATSTLSGAMKRKQPAPTPTLTKKKKVAAKGLCLLTEATPLYPSENDKGNHLHAGVPSEYFSSHYGGTTPGYACNFSNSLKESGKIVEECSFFSSVKAQLSTHIRQYHLGVAVCCYLCGKRTWSSSAWYSHMEKVHTTLQKDDYFIKEGVEIAKLEVKAEVTVDDI